MHNIYFTRHGETVWNVENKICGMTDSPLTARGQQQARQLGELVRDSGLHIDEILYSPLSRAADTAKAIAAATEKLEKGEIHVFDCSTFTVKGETLTSYMADVDAGDNSPDTEVVHDGYFAESEKRSAPYFDVDIDGITLLNK